MSKSKKSVWFDIYEDDVKAQAAENKSKLMMSIEKSIKTHGWTQKEATEKLGVSQPRISDIVNGKLSLFTLDALIELNRKAENTVTIEVKCYELA